MIIHIVIIIIDGNLFIMGLGHPRKVFEKTPEPYVPNDRDKSIVGTTQGQMSQCVFAFVSLPMTVQSAISFVLPSC